MAIEIINKIPFVMTVHGDLGIADANGSSASQAWCISDEILNEMNGEKFGWFAPDGNHYIDHRNMMRRPNEKEIIDYLELSAPLFRMAIEKGYIEIKKEVTHE